MLLQAISDFLHKMPKSPSQRPDSLPPTFSLSSRLTQPQNSCKRSPALPTDLHTMTQVVPISCNMHPKSHNRRRWADSLEAAHKKVMLPTLVPSHDCAVTVLNHSCTAGTPQKQQPPHVPLHSKRTSHLAPSPLTEAFMAGVAATSTHETPYYTWLPPSGPLDMRLPTVTSTLMQLAPRKSSPTQRMHPQDHRTTKY